MRVPMLIAAVVLAASPALAGIEREDYGRLRRGPHRRGVRRRLHHVERGRDDRTAGRARLAYPERPVRRRDARRAVGDGGGFGRSQPRHSRNWRHGARVGQGVRHRGRARHAGAAGCARRVREGRVWCAHRRGRRGQTGARFGSTRARTRWRCRAPTRGSRCSATCTTTRAAARCSGSTRSPPVPTPRSASPTRTASRATALGTKWSHPNKRSGFVGTFSF